MGRITPTLFLGTQLKQTSDGVELSIRCAELNIVPLRYDHLKHNTCNAHGEPQIGVQYQLDNHETVKLLPGLSYCRVVEYEVSEHTLALIRSSSRTHLTRHTAHDYTQPASHFD